MDLNYFDLWNFDCKETGENSMDPSFLLALDELRHKCGFPFIITSGYRSILHSAERKKTSPGTHTKGIAADIYITSGSNRFTVINNAMAMGFTGIGVARTFVHVDMRTTTPVMWTYR